ncbi:MAG: YaeQ family protein [Burkholderiales bacterium]|nr:YaeQ family protein [Burkholderiales bacterium]
MAIKPTVFKMSMQIADMDRHYYNDHLLTIAQHPSETDERMMVRILAFALNANENLSFAEGITDQNQADLWDRDHNEQVKLWISVGLPDERLIRKAVSRSEEVIVYAYGGRQADMWWSKQKLMAYKNLKVINLSSEDTQSLATMASRGMKINFTMQEGEIMISDDASSINITPQVLK